MNPKIEKIKQYLLELVNLQDHVDVTASAENIKKNVHFRGPNVYILFFAIVIASVGLNVNSIPVIIGAMLISPLMGPIIGFGLGLGTNDMDLIKCALKNLAVMVLISIFASTLYFLVTPLDMDHPTELLARTNPSIYDVFIALFGGLAGILETSRKERGTVMAGVAIATALMPPLCTVGYGLANWEPQYFLGALYLFLLNGILISLATFLIVKFLRYPAVEAETVTLGKRRAWTIGLVLALLLVPGTITTVRLVHENNFARNAKQFMAKHHVIGDKGTYVYNYEIDAPSFSITLFLAGEKLDEQNRQHFYAEALDAGFAPNQIVIKDEATSEFRERMSDEELLRDLLKSQEEQINMYKQRIEQLEKEQIIPTQSGQALSWKYLTYVREHPIVNWEKPTRILYAENDNLIDLSVVDDFSRRFHCHLTIMKGGEHWFHTPEQLAVLHSWIEENC